MCLTLAFYFIYDTYNAHILDISLFLHIHLCIGYNHSNMRGLISTQHPTFSIFDLPLRNYRSRDYHSKVPYL
jgi:hypothetical protein